VRATQEFVANGGAGRHVGTAGVLHRRGGRAALAVSVSVAVGVPKQRRWRVRRARSRRLPVAQSSSVVYVLHSEARFSPHPC
jgi:hypothetical protein